MSGVTAVQCHRPCKARTINVFIKNKKKYGVEMLQWAT